MIQLYFYQRVRTITQVDKSKIKKKDHLKNVPVILQSSCGIIEERRGLELGANAFIRKPYTRKDLYTALGELELFDPKILAK